MEVAMVPDQRQQMLEVKNVKYDVQPAEILTNSRRVGVAIVIHLE